MEGSLLPPIKEGRVPGLASSSIFYIYYGRFPSTYSKGRFQYMLQHIQTFPLLLQAVTQLCHDISSLTSGSCSIMSRHFNSYFRQLLNYIQTFPPLLPVVAQLYPDISSLTSGSRSIMSRQFLPFFR